MLPYGYELLEKNSRAIVLGIGELSIAFSPAPKQVKLDGQTYKYYGDVRVPRECWGTICRIRKYKLK